MKSSMFPKPVLAVHWTRSTLDYVLADRKGGHVRIMAAGSVPLEDEEEPIAPGLALARELKQLRVRRADLVVALGRGSVDVVPLQLPPASDVELPTLVNNQVMRDAGDIAESGTVDFVALPAAEGEPRTGFAFAVDRVTLEQVQAEAARASLKPSAIVYRPLASMTLLRRAVPQSRRTMILATLHDREADISIVRGSGLLYTRTARLSETRNVGDIAAQLATEIRRSLAAASLAPDAEDQHLYVFGALQETEQLVTDLAEELSLPASLLDPLRAEHVVGPTPDAVGRLSPLLGAVYDQFGKSHAIDFLHPKEPPPPPNYVRRAASYAAVALALCGAGGYYLWEAHSQDLTEIADLQKTLNNTTTRLEKVQEKQAVVDAILQWQVDNVNWLDELYDLARRFPDGRDAMIRRLSVMPSRDGRSLIDISVHVRDQQIVRQMEDALRDEYHDVRNNGVSEGGGKDYPWQFDSIITLQRRETEDYREEPTPPEPDGEIAAAPVQRK